MNFKQGGGQKMYARCTRELILWSPTFKTMPPLLNAVHWYTSPDPVSNSTLLELKGWKERVGETETGAR